MIDPNVKCPKCKQPMILSKDKRSGYCPKCGSRLAKTDGGTLIDNKY